jgi:hypothetical protein
VEEGPETVETTDGRTEKAEADEARQMTAKRRDTRKDFMIAVDVKEFVKYFVVLLLLYG